MKVNAMDLKPAPYNPRVFDEAALTGLSTSIDEFGDISGITWNSRTGNLVTGHHRWEQLCEKYGKENLVLKQVGKTDRHLIITKDIKNTGYTVRVVDWDLAKEKSANLVANSHAVEGKFTSELQEVLNDIKPELDEGLFGELRLDALEIKLPNLNEVSKKDNQKSETVISGGGESYKLVKMELSPELAKRLNAQLKRLGKHFDGSSVEQPLDAMVTYLEGRNIDEIVWATKSKQIRSEGKEEKPKKRRRKS